MKIEELPNIDIKRVPITDEIKRSRWLTQLEMDLIKKQDYLPEFSAMADSYSIISKVLDKDCVVAYITDKSQTTFLIKTKKQYVGFVSLSSKLSIFLSSNSTRKITRLPSYYKGDRFMELADDGDLIVVDKELWDKYLKTKLLEQLENE